MKKFLLIVLSVMMGGAILTATIDILLGADVGMPVMAKFAHHMGHMVFGGALTATILLKTK